MTRSNKNRFLCAFIVAQKLLKHNSEPYLVLYSFVNIIDHRSGFLKHLFTTYTFFEDVKDSFHRSICKVSDRIHPSRTGVDFHLCLYVHSLLQEGLPASNHPVLSLLRGGSART